MAKHSTSHALFDTVFHRLHNTVLLADLEFFANVVTRVPNNIYRTVLHFRLFGLDGWGSGWREGKLKFIDSFKMLT